MNTYTLNFICITDTVKTVTGDYLSIVDLFTSLLYCAGIRYCEVIDNHYNTIMYMSYATCKTYSEANLPF